MVCPVTSFSRTIRICAVLLIATLTIGQWRSSAKNLAQDINQPQTLRLGVPVESEITAGQSLTWQISLSEGDYLRLLVDAKLDNVTVELFAPGQSRQSGDKPLFSDAAGTVLTFHQERIFAFIAEASGNYGLEAHASNKEASSKQYKVKAHVKERRPATPRDRTRVEAERAELEAGR